MELNRLSLLSYYYSHYHIMATMMMATTTTLITSKGIEQHLSRYAGESAQPHTEDSDRLCDRWVACCASALSLLIILAMSLLV